jgi:hypothetical protein
VNYYCPNHPPYDDGESPNGFPSVRVYGARAYCDRCLAVLEAPERQIETLVRELEAIKARAAS